MMKLISTLIAKKTLTVALLMMMATIVNGRVFWNKFDVNVTNDKTVVLTWNVTEYNNKSFHIQVSPNGTDWQDIALVPSKNSAESMVDYSFTHSNKQSGKQFYRISELDVDVNSTGFSPIRTLILQNEKQPVISIWPNPATSHVVISGSDNENIYTQARIFDLAGKKVADKKLDGHSNKIAINELPAGTYIVQIENNAGSKYSQKIIKQ